MAENQRNTLLSDICSSIGSVRLRTNFICIYEIEEEIQSLSPPLLKEAKPFDRHKKGNYVTIPLETANILGMHAEDPTEMPMSPLKNLELRSYLDDVKDYFMKEVREIIDQYAKSITRSFGVNA